MESEIDPSRGLTVVEIMDANPCCATSTVLYIMGEKSRRCSDPDPNPMRVRTPLELDILVVPGYFNRNSLIFARRGFCRHPLSGKNRVLSRINDRSGTKWDPRISNAGRCTSGFMIIPANLAQRRGLDWH